MRIGSFAPAHPSPLPTNRDSAASCARNRPIILAKRAVSHVPAPPSPAVPSPAGTHPPALPRRLTYPAPRESPANSPAPDRPSPARRPGIIRGGTRRNSRGVSTSSTAENVPSAKRQTAQIPHAPDGLAGLIGCLQNRVPTDVDARTDAVGSARQQSVQVPAFAAARVKQLFVAHPAAARRWRPRPADSTPPRTRAHGRQTAPRHRMYPPAPKAD